MAKLVLVVDDDHSWLKETSESLEENDIEAVIVRKASTALNVLGLGGTEPLNNICLACEKPLIDEHAVKYHTCKLKTALSKYQCPQPGCGKSFTLLGMLTKHQKESHGLQECVCPVCSKEFESTPSLGAHKSSHTKQHEQQQIQEHLVLLAIENLRLKQEARGEKPRLVLTKAQSKIGSKPILKEMLKENKIPCVELVPKPKSDAMLGSTQGEQEGVLHFPLGVEEILHIKKYIQ